MAKKSSFVPVIARTSGDIVAELAVSKYVAKADQVGALAKAYVERQKELAAIGGTYLKVLIASTLHALGEPVRTENHRGKAPKLDDKERDRQRSTFEDIQSAFYQAVLNAVITEDLKDNEQLPKAERGALALERNRRTNFARSAASTVRGYLKSGGDLRLVNVSTVTKGYLQDATAAKTPRVSESVALGSRVEAVGKRAVRLIEQLAEQDEGAARHRLESMISQLASLLGHIGVEKTTTSDKQAIEKCIPLKTDAGLFMPITQDGTTLQ